MSKLLGVLMSKSRKIRFSLSIKITSIIIAIVIIAMSIVGVFSYRFSSRAITNSTNERLGAIVKDIAHQIGAINQEHFSQLQMLADMDVFKSENLTLEEKQRFLTGLVSRLGAAYNNIAFYDMEGNAITDGGVTINFATRIYFTEAMAGRRYVSIPAFSKVTNSVLQHYSVPVYGNNGRIIGAMVFVINGNAMQSLIEGVDLGEGRTPVILNNKTKEVVASTDVEGSEKRIEELSKTGTLINNILAGKTGVEDYIEPFANDHLVCAYDLIEGTDWTVCAIAPYRYYFRALNQFKIGLIVAFMLSVIVVAFVIIFSVKAVVRPLLSVKKSIITISTGNADLTQRIDVTADDEIGDVVKGFNSFVAKLQEIIKTLFESKQYLECVGEDLQVSMQDTSASIAQIISNIANVNGQILTQSNSVHETVDAANEISSNIDSLEKMIENQAMCVKEASASVEEMIDNINSVNDFVKKMIESFDLLQRNSAFGISAQNNANEKITMIGQQSKMLQDANLAIATIAEQTNLLAMNAAIEAAHAGEAGKGFSVVADEIRKLSETSTAQSKTIGAELGKIQETINDVVAVSGETTSAFSAVSQSISDTNKIIQQIKTSMEEQRVGSKQIVEALQSMNNSTSEVKMAFGEMSEENKEILEEIQKLQTSTDSIKSSMTEMQKGAERIDQNDTALSEISEKVTDSIKQIDSEIGLFAV